MFRYTSLELADRFALPNAAFWGGGVWGVISECFDIMREKVNFTGGS